MSTDPRAEAQHRGSSAPRGDGGRRLSGRAGKVVRIAALAAAALGLLAQGGRWSGPLDLLTHLAPLYVALGALAILLAVVTRRGWRTTVVAGLVAIVSGLALILPAAETPPRLGAAEPTLKVIQFNVWRGNAQVGPVTDWIVAQKPDLVFLEEPTPALRDRLVARTGWHVVGRKSSVMIFSPHPLEAIGVRPVAQAAVEPTWVNARVRYPGRDFEALAVHFTWPIYDTHDEQGRLLQQVVDRLPSHDLVLGGDFNSTPWSFSRRRDEAALPLSRRDATLFTWPALIAGRLRWPLAFLAIDHVYAGPAWRTVSVRRGPALGSDHLPVVVVLTPVA